MRRARSLNLVLRWPAPLLVPPQLATLHWVDVHRRSRTEEDVVVEVCRILQEAVPALGHVVGADPVPERRSRRSEDLARLEEAVQADLRGPVVLASRRRVSALHGLAGLGKSVLAAVFARSCATRRAFGDGVVWIRLGKEPDVAAALRLAGRGLGDDELSAYPRSMAHKRVSVSGLPNGPVCSSSMMYGTSRTLSHSRTRLGTAHGCC